MSRFAVRLLGLLICSAILVACSQAGSEPRVLGSLPGRGFSFSAAGDHGANSNSAAALARLDRSDVEFHLALGDLDYDETSTDRAWCDYVHDRLPSKGKLFPFEVLVGNHEQDGGPDGRIAQHAGCLPDRLNSTPGPASRYGAEYAFTYPRTNPFAKVIMVAPNLTVDGELHTYEKGSPHRRWLVQQIDSARDDGIGWVIVGMHYPCISSGLRHGCDSGPGILNLLVRKRVDLVLAGHNHIYERSKQLRLDNSDCRRIRPDRFDRDCIVAGWRDGVYRAGAGTLLITAGTFGGSYQGANPGDSERRYFAKVDGDALGFVRYAVRPERIHGRFLSTASSAADSFDIVRR